mgnify:CR=1 FL=1
MEEAFRNGIQKQAPTCTDGHCDAVVTWDSYARKKKGVPLGNWRTKCILKTSCKKCLKQGKRIHKEHCTCNK